MGQEPCALTIVRPAAERLSDARLWQWAGLLERALDQHAQSLESFSHAARLAPEDASIAHGLAQVTLEAGYNAVPLYQRARQLLPANADILLGSIAARMAAGEGADAEAELDQIVAQVPLWIDGHLKLAQLRALLGAPDQAAASFNRALTGLPHEPALWRGLFELYVTAEQYDALNEAVEMAGRANLGKEHWQDYALIAAIECRLVDRADALIHALGIQPGSPMAVWVIRHLIREGRIDQAVRRIDMELATDQRTGIWPYAETAWRMAGDARHHWLCPPELVSVTDLTTFLPPLADLADTLRRLHNATGAFLDQSVRGGTQTDGPLFSRIDPVLQHTRTAVVHAVEAYLRTLPAVDAAHPTLSPRRDRDIRFAGSWSVRLGSGGHHSNHVHPMGWISSALYVALPDAIDAAPGVEAGWLTIGMPPTDLIALPPHQAIKPRAGQLVLFPSWLWHGTRPFSQGERLTIAFDIAPRQ